MLGSSEGFFRRGKTAAVLNFVGKMPSANDRLASRLISSEKTDGQSLIEEVGMKSTEEVLDDMDETILRTSL